jgi:hypothetical protein
MMRTKGFQRSISGTRRRRSLVHAHRGNGELKPAFCLPVHENPRTARRRCVRHKSLKTPVFSSPVARIRVKSASQQLSGRFARFGDILSNQDARKILIQAASDSQDPGNAVGVFSRVQCSRANWRRTWFASVLSSDSNPGPAVCKGAKYHGQPADP